MFLVRRAPLFFADRSGKAYKAVGESVEIPLTYYANNVGATISLLQIMSEYGCTRIVYSSSATVYGTPPTIPIPETTRLKADSPYGKTKVMSEAIIDDLCHGRSWVILFPYHADPLAQLNPSVGVLYLFVTSSEDMFLPTSIRC